jgi:hypothetical protein
MAVHFTACLGYVTSSSEKVASAASQEARKPVQESSTNPGAIGKILQCSVRRHIEVSHNYGSG